MATGPPIDADHALAGAKILVVEDEVLIAFDLRARFEDAGAESVKLAHTLTDAMALAERSDVGVAVLDVRLGRDPVGPVAEALRKRRIPFLFYSGQPASDPVREAWSKVPAVAKPADARTLIGAVNALRRRWASSRPREERPNTAVSKAGRP